jgi:hypothetical protein
MYVPCYCGLQKRFLVYEKLFFLFWVLMNILSDWKTKSESANSFMLNFFKITG